MNVFTYIICMHILMNVRANNTNKTTIDLLHCKSTITNSKTMMKLALKIFEQLTTASIQSNF